MTHQSSKIKKATNHLGIWMDHANAHLMDYEAKSIVTRIIDSQFTHQVKEDILSKGESHMHNKEQHMQAEYYNALAEVIKNYKEVILFGPTEAKIELYKILRADHHFDKIKIDIQQTDKMTENQKHAFVKGYFTTI